MNRPPSFPFYVKDYLASKSVQRMTPSERGGYVHLLCHCWNDDNCSLPKDDEELRLLSGLDSEGWLKGGSTKIRKCFIQHPEQDGCLTSPKLWELWQKARIWATKSCIGGIRSGESRGNKNGGGSRVVQPPSNFSFASASSSSKDGDDSPSPREKRQRKVREEVVARWREWLRWFAHVYEQETGHAQPGYDPESKKMPHPRLQGACRWVCKEVDSGRTTSKKMDALLRMVFQGRFYIARPPGDLAEWMRMYSGVLAAKTKDQPVVENPGAERNRGMVGRGPRSDGEFHNLKDLAKKKLEELDVEQEVEDGR